MGYTYFFALVLSRPIGWLAGLVSSLEHAVMTSYGKQGVVCSAYASLCGVPVRARCYTVDACRWVWHWQPRNIS